MNSKDISRQAILIALFFILINTNPIGWGVLQFRIGEALTVIPFFNRKYTFAMIIASGLANIFSPLGALDVLVGLLCSSITYAISKHIESPRINALVFSVVSGIIVSFLLLKVYNAPYIPSFFSIFFSVLVITMVGVSIFKIPAVNKIIME